MAFDGKLTVADLLREESLRLRLVGGARGLRSRVTGVHISEIPDPTPWLSPGDLLLTTGLAVSEDEASQAQLVCRLKAAGMSGVGVGVDIFMHETSAVMRAEADAQQLPLFEVPFEIPFKAITGLVFHSLHSADFYQLRRSLTVQDRLLSLLLEDRGIDHLVSSVAMLLSTSMVVFDAVGQVVSQAYARTKVTPHLRELTWQTYLTHGCRCENGIHGLQVEAHEVFFDEVRVGGRVEHVLCFLYPKGEGVSEMGRVIAAYVAKLLTLELHRTRDEVLLQERMRAGLLDDILSGLGREEDLADRLVRFGFAPGRPLCLALIDIDDFAGAVAANEGLRGEESIQRLKTEFKESTDYFFSSLRVPFMSLSKSDAVVVVFQGPFDDPDALRALGHDLVGQLERSLPAISVTIGFGESYTEPGQVRRSFDQAREAKVARHASGGSGRVRLFSDLGPRIRSLENQTPERLEYFVQSTLGPLVTYDAERGERLLETLQVYLDADRSVGRSAELLFVHPNTLRNRLRKVEELLGLSLDSTDSLVDVSLALQAMRILARTRGRRIDGRVVPDRPRDQAEGGAPAGQPRSSK